MNTDKVQGRMKELKINAEQMAKAMGMCPSTFYRKMKNEGKDFSVGDLCVMRNLLQWDKKDAADFLLP